MNSAPPLPPGYTLDAPAGNVPPPPPGYTLDAKPAALQTPPGISVTPPVPPPAPPSVPAAAPPPPPGGIVGQLHDAGARMFDQFSTPSHYQHFSEADIAKMSPFQQYVRPFVDAGLTTYDMIKGGLAQTGRGLADAARGGGQPGNTAEAIAGQLVPGFGMLTALGGAPSTVYNRMTGGNAPAPGLDVAQGLMGAATAPVSATAEVLAAQPIEHYTGSPVLGTLGSLAAQAAVPMGEMHAPVRAAEGERLGAPLPGRAFDLPELIPHNGGFAVDTGVPYGPSDPYAATLHPWEKAALEPEAPATAAARAAAADRDNWIATPQSIIDRAELRAQRLEDQAAAERSGVRMPPGMLMSAPLQGVTQTLGELPFTSRPIRQAIETAYRDLAKRREDIAGEFGTTSGPAGLGAVAKGAMDDTQKALLERDKGDAEAIAQSLGRSASARDMGQIASEAIERFRDKSASPDVIGKMATDELQKLKGAPASASSSPLQLAAAYELAAREIPENMFKGRSKPDEDRFMGGMENTRQVLLDIAKRNQAKFSQTEKDIPRPGIGEGIGEAKSISDAAYPVTGRSTAALYVRSLLNTPIRFNIQAMRGIRTDFGAMVRALRPEDAGTIQAADLARIQQAQTADIINLLDRNAKEYAANPQKTYDVQYGGKAVKMTGQELAARTQNAKQLYFEADAMTKANKEHMETLKRFYGNETTPDQIGRAIFSDATSKASNIDRLGALKAALRPAEWKEIGAGVLRDMWRTNETDFSPEEFRKGWQQMPPETKQILFGRKAKALDDVANSGSAEQIAALRKAYGSLPDEAVAGRVLADAKEGTPGNIARLRQLFDASTPQQANEIRAGLFRMLGRVTGDATGIASEIKFNPGTFAKNWKDMSDEAKNMLFRDTPHRQAIDDFARLCERAQRFEKTANTSRSAYSAAGLSEMLAPFAAAGSALMGHWQMAGEVAGGMAGAYLIGKGLSSTRYANWLTRAVELNGKGASPLAMRTHLNTLYRVVRQVRDPEERAAGMAMAKAFGAYLQAHTPAALPGAASAGANERNRQAAAAGLGAR